MSETLSDRDGTSEGHFSISAVALAATVALAVIAPFTGAFQVFLQPGWVDPGLYLGAFLNLPANLRDYGATYQSMRLPFTLVGYALHHSFPHDVATYIRVLLFNTLALTSLSMIVAPRCGRAAAAVAVLSLGLNPIWIAALTRGYVDGAAMTYAFAALAFFFNRDDYGRPNLFVFLFGVFSCLTLFGHPAAFIGFGLIVVAQYCYSRKSLKLRAVEFAIGAAGFLTATALLSFGSKALGGSYLFFSSILPQVSAAVSGFGVNFQYPLSQWLPAAVRLAPACGLVVFSLVLLLVYRRAANQVLVSGTFGLVALGAFMIVQDSIVGGVFLQSSYYAGYLLIGQSLVVGGAAGMAFKRGPADSDWTIIVVAASIVVTLILYSYVDVLWKVASRIDRTSWAIWSTVLIAFVLAASAYSLGYRRSALMAVCIAIFISGALNEDTRNVFKTPNTVNYKSTFDTAMQTFEAVQKIAPPGNRKLFMFNRDDLTAKDERSASTTYGLLYEDVNYVMNLWDTIASLWAWDRAIVGGYLPEIHKYQLMYLQAKDGPPTTVVSFCIVESKCDLIERALSEKGIAVKERGRAVISGFGYVPFFVRVSDL